MKETTNPWTWPPILTTLIILLFGTIGVTGVKGRWKRFLLNKILAANAHLHDTNVSPVVRQTLLHWAYEVTEKDLQDHLKK